MGEALAKNSAAGGIGLGAGALGYASMNFGLALAGVSNPVGWAVIGGVAAATIATTVFNFAYDNNFFDMQEGLDWAGQQIDKSLNWANEQLNKTGEYCG